jgi:DNA adenine methylase
MEFYSPLRYPGGKGKVANYFKQIIRDNLLFDCTYVEPYAGGASIALSLLFNQYASSIIINDKDKSIYAFWYSVINNTDEFIRRIETCKVSVTTWKKQRAIQMRKKEEDLFSLGFSTFFLNRTNRSGIIRAGIIGGENQKGNWKIDARFNRKDLIKRIEKIALHKEQISVTNLDALSLVRTIEKNPRQKVLFYFDPPYYIKGKELYLNFYSHKDHVRVAEVIARLRNRNWIVTYDNIEEISKLYVDFRKRVFSLNYSAGKTAKGEELMIFSNDLFISPFPIIKKAG